MICGVTGHRPNKLGGYNRVANDNLYNFAIHSLKNIALVESPIESVLTGMALGWDTAIANACIHLKIPFIAVLPFEGHHSKWPPFQQELFYKLIDKAKKVVNVSGKNYFENIFYQDRNEYIVDNCDTMLALWNGTSGGTKNCLSYAEKVNRHVYNLWIEWSAYANQN